MNYQQKFEEGLSYDEFLKQHAKGREKENWDRTYDSLSLSDSQKSLLQGFQRKMKVMVLAGAWCGDCVDQCPIFQKFAEVSENILLRFFDRDVHADLAQRHTTCGGMRVPTVLFFSEDDTFCGQYGDKTLVKYRKLSESLAGGFCPSGLLSEESELQQQIIQEWLNQFERIQWILRLSGRLRRLHGD